MIGVIPIVSHSLECANVSKLRRYLNLATSYRGQCCILDFTIKHTLHQYMAYEVLNRYVFTKRYLAISKVSPRQRRHARYSNTWRRGCYCPTPKGRAGLSRNNLEPSPADVSSEGL